MDCRPERCGTFRIRKSMDHKTSKGNCSGNHRSGAVDTQRTSASCLEFEGSFRQFVYDLRRDTELRFFVMFLFVLAAAICFLFILDL